MPLPQTRRIAGIDYDLGALFDGRLDGDADFSLEEALARYRKRVLKPAGWWDEVLAHARAATSRCVRPSMVFALPTRNRECTSRAVDALRQACAGAFVVVYHNYTQPPRQAVVADLDRLRDAVDVLLVERVVEPRTPIGETRGFAVDVALALAAALELRAGGAQPPGDRLLIGSADSDITGFLDGAAYERVRAAFAADPRLGATTHRRYIDLLGLVPDVNLLLLGMIDNLGGHVHCFEKRAPCSTVGAAAVFDPVSLCRVGGIPPVEVGEDLLMQDALERLGGDAASTLTIAENGVFCDHRAQLQDLGGHYEHWTTKMECDVPEVPRRDDLRLEAPMFLRRAVAAIFLDAMRARPHQAPRFLGEIEACTAAFERLARALPSMSLDARLEVARAAMAEPRRIPPC